MNTQNEISKLLERSNKEYLQRFVNYAEPLLKKSTLRSLFREYTNNSVMYPTKCQCAYTIKRGANNGTRCSVMVKDGKYCSKHKKYAPNDIDDHKVSLEQSLKVDLDNISDEDDPDEEEDDIEDEEIDDASLDGEDWVSDKYDDVSDDNEYY